MYMLVHSHNSHVGIFWRFNKGHFVYHMWSICCTAIPRWTAFQVSDWNQVQYSAILFLKNMLNSFACDLYILNNLWETCNSQLTFSDSQSATPIFQLVLSLDPYQASFNKWDRDSKKQLSKLDMFATLSIHLNKVPSTFFCSPRMCNLLKSRTPCRAFEAFTWQARRQRLKDTKYIKIHLPPNQNS